MSKWETGHSIPDTGLLIPLSEILGVSVTELLSCKLLDKEDTLQKTDVEELVKTAVSYPKERDKRIWQTDRKILLLFLIAMLLEAILILLNYKKGFITKKSRER